MGNMPKKNYDVVIVGAGPSGAAAARGLANERLEVLILEKKKLPRYKMCSGIIFKKSQDITERLWGKIPGSAYVTPKLLKGVRLWSDNKHFSDWPFNSAPNVWRSEYDYWLIKNSGAEVKDCCSLKGFKDYGNYIMLECHDTRNNETINIRCKYLVRKTGCMGNDMCTSGRFYLGKGKVLLVGEAAGFLNAFGEGISCALSTGLFAAEVITKGIKSGNDALAIYTELTKLERRQTKMSWKLGAKIAGRDLMPI